MKTITIAEIRSFNPCYDPNKYLSETFNSSLKEILENKEIPSKDRLWVVVRPQLMSQLQLKYYGLGCARLAEQFTTNPIVKSCNDATEAYLKGNIGKEELLKHRNAAYSAAYSAYSAASDAAYSAYSAAAYAAYSSSYSAAAYSAAAYAAYSAAYSAYSAASNAAYSSASDAASDASAAAYAYASYAAYSAAAYAYAASYARNEMREKQCKLLINILETIE